MYLLFSTVYNIWLQAHKNFNTEILKITIICIKLKRQFKNSVNEEHFFAPFYSFFKEQKTFPCISLFWHRLFLQWVNGHPAFWKDSGYNITNTSEISFVPEFLICLSMHIKHKIWYKRAIFFFKNLTFTRSNIRKSQWFFVLTHPNWKIQLSVSIWKRKLWQIKAFHS